MAAVNRKHSRVYSRGYFVPISSKEQVFFPFPRIERKQDRKSDVQGVQGIEQTYTIGHIGVWKKPACTGSESISDEPVQNISISMAWNGRDFIVMMVVLINGCRYDHSEYQLYHCML